MTTRPETRLCVLVLAGGAGWEGPALQAMAEAGLLVVKRCVDVPDLMASAASSGATVAVVDGDLPHLDADAVMHLLRYDVRMLAVTSDPWTAERLLRLGVVETGGPDPTDIVSGVRRVSARDVVVDPDPVGRHLDADRAPARGRIIAVWGPAGAPGRTTVAVGIAGELASGGRPVVLVDADPYGGAVAQQLGVLDELSGLLSAARMANLGTLDLASLTRSCRRVSTQLDVLTGLPRADRRVEVRPGVIGTVLDVAAELGEVVVDCGFCLEDAEAPLARDRMTLDALASADEVVAVGTAEPSGLSRLARGLVELRDVAPGMPVRVVVNRMRTSLGWSERDIVGMIEGYVRPAGVHFLPEDRETVDKALVAGRGLDELGRSQLRTAFDGVVSAMYPDRASAAGSRPAVRLRRAGTGR